MTTDHSNAFRPRTDRAVERMRVLCRVMEGGVAFVVVASVVAVGSVHPWAYLTLWVVITGLAALLAYHMVLEHRLLQSSGSSPRTGQESDEAPGKRLSPRASLLLPGLTLLGWILFQLVPLPPAGRPLSVAPLDTLRGLGFVVAATLLHLVAAAIFRGRAARRRFRHLVAGLGLVLALAALVQHASGTSRIYGVFEPWEEGAIFGPFVNRNHFAGYMLLVAPICFSLLARAFQRRARSARPPGVGPSWRDWPVAHDASALFGSVAGLAAVAALFATASRGATLAFAAGVLLAGASSRSRPAVRAWAVGAAVVALALAWAGPARIQTRFARAAADSTARTAIWADALQRMHGRRWLTGWGFNTFAPAMSRVDAWALPVGATPWPPELEASRVRGSKAGFRVPAQLGGSLHWRREAHNEYVQVLVETGLPGLVIALWAAARILLGARRDPWLLAALAGVLAHSVVDFDLQIPAISLLVVVLAALGRPSERRSRPA